LVYCEVAQDYRAKGDVLWFYVSQENQATCKIFWVQQENKADVKVFKTSQDYRAKWNKNNKFQNRIG
jgi:hypothetical protein